MIDGEVEHEDFHGHRGVIGKGDVQWMTAGKGIMHCEMATSETVPGVGFQLWINLANKVKFCEPGYQEFTSNQVPLWQDEEKGVSARVIAGDVFGVKGPIEARTPTYYIDFWLDKKGDKHRHTIPGGWNVLVFIYKGKATINGSPKEYAGLHALTFNRCGYSEDIVVTAADNNTKFILLAGQPLDEPIINYGPFVLASHEDMAKCFDDYHLGINGFENSRQWRSEIKKNYKFRAKSV